MTGSSFSNLSATELYRQATSKGMEQLGRIGVEASVSRIHF